MGNNTFLRWGLFLIMSAGINTLAAGKWFSFSASDFIKDPDDSGFRRTILSIPKNQVGSFHRFLALYDKASSAVERMKIMQTYYKNYCEDAFELLSLIYFFHSYDPTNPLCEKILLNFLKDHHFQRNVTAVFFASYSTLSSIKARSFRNILVKLYKRCPELTMPNLATLHFVDLMLSQEARSLGSENLRHILIKLWRKEIPSNILDRGVSGAWIRKVLAFYELRQSWMPVFKIGIDGFLSGKRRLFESHGYSAEQIVEAFWDQFIIPASAYDVPDFIPSITRSEENQGHTKKPFNNVNRAN